jgi:hypothetical protein
MPINNSFAKCICFRIRYLPPSSLFSLLPYFEKIKAGLWYHLAVCVYVCLYVYPLIAARQRFGRHVPVVTNTHSTIGTLLDGSFSMRSVQYQGKVGDQFFLEFLIFSSFFLSLFLFCYISILLSSSCAILSHVLSFFTICALATSLLPGKGELHCSHQQILAREEYYIGRGPGKCLWPRFTTWYYLESSSIRNGTYVGSPVVVNYACHLPSLVHRLCLLPVQHKLNRL